MLTGRRTSLEIRIAQTEQDLLCCYPVIAQLRPHLNQQQFIEQVQRQQKEGYRLAYLVERQTVQAAAGYRVLEMLSRGRFLYVDDLVTTSESRSMGYGEKLMKFLLQEARLEGCQLLDLDSGVQRHGAHRFYFQQGMSIASYHFSIPVEKP